MKLKRVFAIFTLVFNVSAQAGDASLYDAGLEEWRDSANKSFQLKELAGHKVVLAMVYTSCQGACPMIAKKLLSIKEKLESEKIEAEFVVVSFDSHFDTPKKMEIFGATHRLVGKEWHLLVGSEKNTRFLANLLGVHYSINPKDFTIGHDNKVILLDEKGSISTILEGLKFHKEEKLF